MAYVERRLRADEIRALPVGAPVRIYHYDRRGELVYTDCRVIQQGRAKRLRTDSPWAPAEEYPIRKETERRWYAVKEVSLW